MNYHFVWGEGIILGSVVPIQIDANIRGQKISQVLFLLLKKIFTAKLQLLSSLDQTLMNDKTIRKYT